MTLRNYDFITGVETDVVPGSGYFESSKVYSTGVDYTILDNDNYGTIIVTDTTVGRTVSLPTCADNTNRKICIIKATADAGTVTIDGEGAETIDGTATYTLLFQYENIYVQSDGIKWTIITSRKNVAGALLYTEITADQTMVSTYGYITNKAGTACSLTLPAVSAVGDVIAIVGKGSTGWKIMSNASVASQYISRQGVSSTASSSSAIELCGSLNHHDSITIVCTIANTEWTIIFGEGASFKSFEKTVYPKTADYTIKTGEALNNCIFTNAGTSGTVKFTLPSAVSGYSVGFIVTDEYRFEIEAASGDVIYTQNASASSKIFTLTKGSAIQLYAVDSTNWFAIDIKTWSDAGAVALFFGGSTGSSDYRNIIESIIMSTAGNATSFGSLATTRRFCAAAASATRALCENGNNGGYLNSVEYVEVSTASNGASFGTSSFSTIGTTGCGNTTRAIFASGYNGSSYINTIEYYTFASLGNGSSFGTLQSTCGGGQASSNTTRALIAKSQSSTTVDYITIATLGNGSSFGTTSFSTREDEAIGNCSTATYAYIGTGRVSSTSSATIDYFTIASTGNGTNFGSLGTARSGAASASSKTKAFYAGGSQTDTYTTLYATIEYSNTGTTASFSSFGNLTLARKGLAGCSNDHGGI